MRPIVILFLSLIAPLAKATPPGKQLLFNGKNLTGWYVFLEKRQKNEDPAQVFTVEDGLLHVSGKEFGYICTEKIYRNYHLTVEFKWGANRYPPRENAKRDNGIMYHIPVHTEDRVWPVGIECQIQEGDVGDFWLVGGTTIEVDGKRNQPGPWVRMAKKRDAEKPFGEWNRVEVISKDGTCTHIVNGVTVATGINPSVSEGKILLQTEGAETYFRKVELEELK
ncbi:3-keto-disaccharide hydrolase [Spirosoma flavum]|uniref:DUF1080 domain-containing protein n=1 Tax=Spirosoma flavum TaxID=2048557 RepID=A0ABW6AQ85_9BACT